VPPGMLFDPSRLDREMELAGLDGLIACSAANVCYLTDIRSIVLSSFPYAPECFAVLSRSDPKRISFVSSFCEIDQVLDADPTVGHTAGFGTFYRAASESVELSDREKRLESIMRNSARGDTALDALVLTIREFDLIDKTIGIDEVAVPHAFLLALQESLPSVRLTPASTFFRKLRRIKTPEEVQRLTDATRIAEDGVRAIATITSEGITEYELAREFEREIVGRGASPGFTLVRIGRNAVAQQALPDSTQLRRGEAVWIDVGCNYRGYWADIARVVTLGPPGDKLKRVYEAARRGEDAGIESARSEMPVADLFRTVADTVRNSGIEHFQRHHVGHAIGLEPYDDPVLSADSTAVLEAGMVINIETPYYEFGFGAVNVEDPILIRPDGARRLGTLPNGLITVD
jgi:Xaa-Pro dipeptidase